MKIEYVAYNDEAGDADLKTVRPIDPNGAAPCFLPMKRAKTQGHRAPDFKCDEAAGQSMGRI